jgi:hypothetical protein
MSLQEDIEEIIPSSIKDDPFNMFSGFFDQFGKVLTTVLIVFSCVIGFIIYIIHLYDSGQLGPNPAQKQRPGGNFKSQTMKNSDEKWAKKNL